MENASKALIIAGAILIAILLISVGILVMNSMNKPIDQSSSEATSQAAQMFNSKFTVYEGKGKSAQDVKGLIQTVIANNKSDTNHQIRIRFKSRTESWLFYGENPSGGPVENIYGKLEKNEKYEIVSAYPSEITTGTIPGFYYNSPNGGRIKMSAVKTEMGYIAIFEIKPQE